MSLLPKDTSAQVQQAVEGIRREFQTRSLPSFDRAPFPAEVPDNGLVLAQVSGTSYLYTKIGGVLYKAAFTPA